MGRLRFCMVTTFYPPYHFGGDGVFVQALSQRLAAQGHTVEVVHCVDAYRLRGSKSPPEHEIANDGPGITVHSLHSRWGAISPLITQQTGRPGLKHAALKRILSQSFDVIHFHNISLIGGPAVLELGKAPIKLYTTHEHWLVCPTHVLWKNRNRPCDKPQCLRCCLISGTPPQLWRSGSLIERSLMHIDAMLSPSQFTAQHHKDRGITRPIHVLPTFSSFEPPTAPAAPPASGRAQFVYVGRLTTSKGIRELAQSFRRLPQYDLLVAGDGELGDALRQEFRDSANIQFLGVVGRGRLVELYQQAAAVIMPCIGPEVFPLVPIEAMACGTPVIVRQAGGSGEAIEQTGGGVVYQTEEELVSAIQRMAGDHEWRSELARRAKAGYDAHYTADQHVSRYLQIIETVRLAKGPASTVGVGG